MAQKRMLDKKISISEQVADLPLEGQIIFTWSIPHADDLGMLPLSHRTLKAMIVPMMNMSQETFDFQVEKIIEKGLWEIFSFKDEKFYRLKKFIQHQTLKKDRQPQTLIKFEFCEKPKDSWAKLEELGFHLEDIGFQMDTEEKRNEEKRREENIPFSHFWQIYPKKTGKKKAEELWNKLQLDDQQKALEDIPKRMSDDKWKNGFIKDPERYIKHEQWNDEIIIKQGVVDNKLKVEGKYANVKKTIINQ